MDPLELWESSFIVDGAAFAKEEWRGRVGGNVPASFRIAQRRKTMRIRCSKKKDVPLLA